MNRRSGYALLFGFLMNTIVFAADGEALFNGTCALCHQSRGVGSLGLAPPLADKALWDRLGSRAPSYIAGVMLAGLSGAIDVAGVTYSGLVMPPQGQLDDEQLAAIGNYVLGRLNDSQEHLPRSLVADMRAAPKTHAQLRELRRSGS